MFEWSIGAGSAAGWATRAAGFASATPFLAGAFLGTAAAFLGGDFFLVGSGFFAAGIGIVIPPWPACWAIAGAENETSASALAALNKTDFIGFFPAIE
jgi:hypothetical protein